MDITLQELCEKYNNITKKIYNEWKTQNPTDTSISEPEYIKYDKLKLLDEKNIKIIKDVMLKVLELESKDV